MSVIGIGQVQWNAAGEKSGAAAGKKAGAAAGCSPFHKTTVSTDASRP